MADQRTDWHLTQKTRGRYELDLTRTCLHQGQVQVPQGLMQVLQEGELTLTDVHSKEPVTLRFAPPRTLDGLKPFFERHNLKPNDRLILTLTEGGGLLDMHRRPPPVRAQRPEPVEETQQPKGSSVVERLVAYGSSRPEIRRRPAGEDEPREESRPGRVRAARLEPNPSAGAGEIKIERKVERKDEAAPRAPRQAPKDPSDAPKRRQESPPAPTRADRTDRTAPPARLEPAGAERPAPEASRLRGPSRDEVATAIREHLHQPGTPAIVRTQTLAGSLRLEAATVEEVLDELARTEDSGIDKISGGVYRHTVLTRSR